MHERKIETYESPKILGDVLEAIIGAIYIDGGLKKCVEVMKPILSPLIVYIAKYIKLMHSEHKEDFFQFSNVFSMQPHFIAKTNIKID